MRTPFVWGTALALVCGLVPAAWGPAAATPAGAGAAAGSAAPAAAAPAAGAPASLWTFLCPTPEQKEACKGMFCNSTFGQLMNNSLKPASALTGGLIPGCCPPVTAADL